jgi:hypothetical protein
MMTTRGLTANLLLLLGGALLAAPVPARLTKPDEKFLVEVSVPPPGFAVANKPSPLKIDLGKTNRTLYADIGTPQTKFRDAVRETQLFLWATSPALPPAALQVRVRALRQRVKCPTALRTTFAIPTNPKTKRTFDAMVFNASRDQARLISHIEQQIERLDEVADLRAKECKRWQANYDLMRAWLLLRIIHLEEVALALGQVRKEMPDHDPKLDKAFALAPCETIRDNVARKVARHAEKALDAIMSDYPDTVWADLASRNRVRSLGVEWIVTR